MKRICIAIFLSVATFTFNSNVFAQDDADEEDDELINLSADVASGFVWRGLVNNMSPVIQPSITFSPGKFSIGTWTSVPFIRFDESQELDVFIDYQITPSISIGICDYFLYDGSGEYNYFDYKRTNTGHYLDLQLSYDGSGKIPVRATVSAIIAGGDIDKTTFEETVSGNLTDDGKNNFSTYIELGYGNKLGGVDWEICMGIVPMWSYFYNIDCPGIVNLGLGVSKSFEITPTYSLPLSLQFTVNPTAKAAWLVAKISLF